MNFQKKHTELQNKELYMLEYQDIHCSFTSAPLRSCDAIIIG